MLGWPPANGGELLSAQEAADARRVIWLGGVMGCRNLTAIIEGYGTNLELEPGPDGPTQGWRSIVKAIPDHLEAGTITMPGFATIELVPQREPRGNVAVYAHGVFQARRHTDGWIIATGTFSTVREDIDLEKIGEKKDRQQHFIELPVSIVPQVNMAPQWWSASVNSAYYTELYARAMDLKHDIDMLRIQLQLIDLVPSSTLPSRTVVLKQKADKEAELRTMFDEIQLFARGEQLAEVSAAGKFLRTLESGCKELFERPGEEPDTRVLDSATKAELSYRVYLDFSTETRKRRRWARIRYRNQDGTATCHEIVLRVPSGADVEPSKHVIGCLQFHAKAGRAFPVYGPAFVPRHEPKW